jgi:hypothetical protein
MTREEIDRKIQEMIAERQLQDEQARKQLRCRPLVGQ